MEINEFNAMMRKMGDEFTPMQKEVLLSIIQYCEESANNYTDEVEKDIKASSMVVRFED